MVMYDKEIKTRENKIKTKDKIEPQHFQIDMGVCKGYVRVIPPTQTFLRKNPVLYWCS